MVVYGLVIERSYERIYVCVVSMCRIQKALEKIEVPITIKMAILLIGYLSSRRTFAFD